MATDYRLTVGARIPPGAMLERIAPCLPERLATPRWSGEGLNVLPGSEFGFQLWLGPPRENEYVGGTGDGGEWEWELPVATSLVFDPADEPMHSIVHNMVAVLARVLATGDEDLAFFFNGDVSYLVRQGGVVTKHHRTDWWNHYPGLNQIIPD